MVVQTQEDGMFSLFYTTFRVVYLLTSGIFNIFVDGSTT